MSWHVDSLGGFGGVGMGEWGLKCVNESGEGGMIDVRFLFLETEREGRRQIDKYEVSQKYYSLLVRMTLSFLTNFLSHLDDRSELQSMRRVSGVWPPSRGASLLSSRDLYRWHTPRQNQTHRPRGSHQHHVLGVSPLSQCDLQKRLSARQ